MNQKDMFDGKPLERQANGVRVRRDGNGDAWANEHRNLGRCYYLTDLDAFMGNIVFSKNGAEETFAEYAPDSFKNHGKVIRSYGLVALFDRKKSMASVHGRLNHVAFSFYLFLCRAFAKSQPVVPKFFFVVGETAPWQMVEANIFTGELSKTIHTYGAGEWNAVWDVVGLKVMRQRLDRWLSEQDPLLEGYKTP